MKKNKFGSFFIAMAMVLTGLFSCNKEDVDPQGPVLETNLASVTFESSTGELTKKLVITSNREWTVSILEWNATTPEADKWITFSPAKGEGNGEVEIMALPNSGAERSVTMKIVASTTTATIKITQYGQGGPEPTVALYDENSGKEVSKIEDKWPFVDQFTGWERSGTLDQAAVTYTGAGANVSNSGAAFDPTEGSPFSGAPYVGLSFSSSTPNRVFQINQINITGESNLTFKFGAVFQSGYSGATVFGPITASSFKLSASLDGISWAPLTYTATQYSTGNWYTCSSEFKVATGSTKLYIKIEATPELNQGYRVDDFKVLAGGNGELITPGGGGDKTYITIQELRALYTGSNVTLTQDKWVKGSVITDASANGGNSVSKKNVVISDGVAGIALRFSADATFAFGDEIEFNVNGISLERYQNGSLQLNGVVNTSTVKVGTKVITPMAITATQLTSGNYESLLVKVADVQVASADMNKPFATTDAHGTLLFVSKDGKTFDVFTSKYAAFKANIVPSGSGALTGVSSVSSGVYQIMINDAAGYANLTGARFTETLTLSFDAPTFSATTLKVGEAIVDGKITIPYSNAVGTESYNITVAVSGAGAAGINPITTAVTKSLTAGNGTITLDITGTPTADGSVTFTVSGIEALTSNTATATVAPAGGGDVYVFTSNVGLPTTDDAATSSYAHKVKANGSTDEVNSLKLGTSSKLGNFTTPALPKTGDMSLTLFATAWKAVNNTKVKITVIDGGTINGSESVEFAINANEGASGTPPYIMVVDNTFKYTYELKGITAASKLKIETTVGNRAIIFGVNVD